MKKYKQEYVQHIAGVIDIGSSAIRMVVMEIMPNGEFRKIDRANKPVQLGRDVFVNRVLGRDTINQALIILAGFKDLMAAWGLKVDEIYVIATSAIREAKNRETFLDRVFIKTGLKIRIVDGVEENHLTYLAVLHAVGELKSAMAKTASLIMEVGGGSTELMIMDRGKMVAAHVFRLGTLRFDHLHGASANPFLAEDTFIEEQFHTTIEGIKSEFSLSRIRYFVMVGGDARTAAVRCGEKRGEHFMVISREKFMDFMRQVAGYSVDECVKKLDMTWYEAESFVPALQTYKVFLEQTSAQEIIVPDVSIREGVILRFALGNDALSRRQFEAQVLASSISLGKKFHFDQVHAVHVCKLCEMFFDQFMQEHGMQRRERLFLQIAAILHDIGYFVRASGHHKHGAYLVANSEVFGLSVEDLSIIALIVRYHRGVKPLNEHQEYAVLSQEGRMTVIKCAAILRICDSLDRSHTQRIKDISLRIEDDVLLTCGFAGDLSLERHAVGQKGELFEDVFGYRIVLT